MSFDLEKYGIIWQLHIYSDDNSNFTIDGVDYIEQVIKYMELQGSFNNHIYSIYNYNDPELCPELADLFKAGLMLAMEYVDRNFEKTRYGNYVIEETFQDIYNHDIFVSKFSYSEFDLYGNIIGNNTVYLEFDRPGNCLTLNDGSMPSVVYEALSCMYPRLDMYIEEFYYDESYYEGILDVRYYVEDLNNATFYIRLHFNNYGDIMYIDLSSYDDFSVEGYSYEYEIQQYENFVNDFTTISISYAIEFLDDYIPETKLVSAIEEMLIYVDNYLYNRGMF